jgi:L,D-peptidoglycan transpeptidase YkuD (ErfK/YbiS/YcfS/YnhG family)
LKDDAEDVKFTRATQEPFLEGEEIARFFAMSRFHLYPSPIMKSRALLVGGGLRLWCAIGRRGVTSRKREGDGATPRGSLRLLTLYRRQDHWRGASARLPARSIRPHHGWCDDPRSPRYNRLVTIPFSGSHEILWREDHLYDLVIETDWNARPAKRGCGSAIFIHLARPGLAPTEGCLAFHRKDLALLLRRIGRESRVVIH